MMGNKKALCLLLAGLMAVGATACAGTTPKGEGAKNGGATATEPENTVKLTGNVNKYGWDVPEETVKFSYYYAGDATLDAAEEETRLEETTKVLKDEFNVEIERVVYKQDATERLNLMLAGDAYPDTIVGMDDTMAETFISQDRAQELTPYLDEYGQNLKDGFGNYLNLLKNSEGKLYKLATGWGHTTDVMGRDFAIRNDLLEKAKLNFPDSLDSFYQAVKTIVEQNPTNANGEKTYGITAFSEKGEELYQAPLAYLGLYGAPTGYYKMGDDGKITHWVDTEEGLRVAKYINQFWRDGLIDPDFQTKDYDTSVSFMSNERVVANIGTWWHSYVGGHQIWMTTDKDWKIDKRMQSVTFEDGGAKPALIGDNFIRKARAIITDKAVDPTPIMMYWNWETSPMGVAFTGMGPEGEDRAWKIDENGDAKVNDMYWYGNPDDAQFAWGAWEEKQGSFNYWMLAPGYTTVKTEADPAAGWAEPVKAVNMWDLIPDYTKMDESKLATEQVVNLENAKTAKPYLWDQTMWTTSFAADDPVGIIHQDVKENLVTDWVKVITAKTEEECAALFEDMGKHMHELGLDELIAAQQTALDTNSDKFEGTATTAE